MKYLNYILILAGALVAMYAKTSANPKQYWLIIGIVLIMLGVYRIARTIPSRNDDENSNPENE